MNIRKKKNNKNISEENIFSKDKKNVKSFREKEIGKITKKKDKNYDENELKISKFSLPKKNKIYTNNHSTSNNKINSSINRDTLNTINNSNPKINRIKRIKDKNLKNIRNKNKEVKKRSYFEYFNKNVISSNYFDLELNNEIKTTRQYRNRYLLKSSSNSKLKSSKSISIHSTKKQGENIFYDEIARKKSRSKNYLNIKINILKPPLLKEGKYSKNKDFSLNRDNIQSIAKSNSVTKSKFSQNNVKNKIINRRKKYLKSNKNIDNINIPLKIEIITNKNKVDSLQKRNVNTDNKNKNFKTMKKLELKKITKLRNRNQYYYLEGMSSNFQTLKSSENQLTERNNNYIKNIINNKKYDILENDLNNKKIKNFSCTLQKIIPSLKGISNMEKKPLKKSVNNLISDINNRDNKRKSNNEILKKINRNKLIKNFDKNFYKKKGLSKNNISQNKFNVQSNNNTIKKRKISPINKSKQSIKTTIFNENNTIDSNKELSKINKNLNIYNKINPLKIEEIKSIKIYNLSKNDTKSKTSRQPNNSHYKEGYIFKNKYYEDLNNIMNINLIKESQENKNLVIRINQKKINNKYWKNINELLISILTKNKINVIKTENNNEYICKKGNNKIYLELNKINNTDYSVSINNINSNPKEFEAFKKQILNIFNLSFI